MLWRVVLAFKADPDVVLWGCNIAIVDTKGTRYDAESRQFHSFGATPIQTCVPDDTPGPKPAIGSTAKPKVADGESPRPRDVRGGDLRRHAEGRGAGQRAGLVGPAEVRRAAGRRRRHAAEPAASVARCSSRRCTTRSIAAPRRPTSSRL